MAWDHKYRRLEYNEVIKDGDEVDVCRDGWRDPPKWERATNIGEKAPDPNLPSHSVYRRRLKTDNDHETHEHCWCRPVIEEQPNGSRLIIHNSLDRREEYEQSKH